MGKCNKAPPRKESCLWEATSRRANCSEVSPGQRALTTATTFRMRSLRSPRKKEKKSSVN
jgi:hypothetical protein